jgi:hypothetical protein
MGLLWRSRPKERASKRQPDTRGVIKPEGRFVRDSSVRPVGDRTPESVTRIRPEDKQPILPGMPYIPPA